MTISQKEFDRLVEVSFRENPAQALAEELRRHDNRIAMLPFAKVLLFLKQMRYPRQGLTT